jgi:hypothetical protein
MVEGPRFESVRLASRIFVELVLQKALLNVQNFCWDKILNRTWNRRPSCRPPTSSVIACG